MPRTLELHGLLGTLTDVLDIAGRPLPTELYLPHAREPVRVFEMAPHIEPTPDRPYVCNLPLCILLAYADGII